MCEEINWEEKKQIWISMVENLCDEIQTWCDAEGWSVQQELKYIEEEHIGRYQLPFLYIQTPNLRAHIDPIGLNIVGAMGRVDILAFPSMQRFLLIRDEDSWNLLTDSRVPWPVLWGKDCFSQIISSLSATA